MEKENQTIEVKTKEGFFLQFMNCGCLGAVLLSVVILIVIIMAVVIIA